MIARLQEAVRWRFEWLWWRGLKTLPNRRTVRANRLGLDLELDLRDNVQEIVYRDGAYEPNLAARLQDTLQAGDVYVDLGAHVGVHALTIARQLQQLD